MTLTFFFFSVPEDYDPDSVRSKQIIENFKIKDETNTESDENDDSDDEKSTAKDTSKKCAREEKENPSKSKKRKMENKDKISENVQVEFL